MKRIFGEPFKLVLAAALYTRINGVVRKVTMLTPIRKGEPETPLNL